MISTYDLIQLHIFKNHMACPKLGLNWRVTVTNNTKRRDVWGRTLQTK